MTEALSKETGHFDASDGPTGDIIDQLNVQVFEHMEQLTSEKWTSLDEPLLQHS
jgi:hypothetical protein